MGSPAEPVETPDQSVKTPQVDAESPTIDAGPQPATENEGAAESRVPKPRGLWGMMRQSQDVSPNDENADPPDGTSKHQLPKPEFSSASDAAAVQTPAPRSLFALMRHASESETADAKNKEILRDPAGDGQISTSAMESRRSAELSAPMANDREEPDEDDEQFERASRLTAAIDPSELEPSKYRVAADQARRQGRIGFACGIGALVASALSLWPNFFASLPATVLGFAGIISSYLALTGAGRRDITRATRGICLVGMLFGTTGIFLGPLLFASLGRTLRESTGLQGTRRHLQQIGEGLEQHYSGHDGYPVGGMFARGDDGAIHGQHGWMTFLLPAIGESDLYRQIDQSKPFDDQVNRNAMGRNVNLYFAAGGDRSRIGQGYAVSHFAGLGGEIDQTNGLAHIGIFERDVAVKREEITDGASNTLIVGELAGLYPPWGDPENWRKIGKGLNRDINGFGSYTGNGATFLLADGSVKFFPNKTDPKLLEQMSTRDGAE